MLAVRVTRSFVDLESVFSQIISVSKALVVYEHNDASRVHCHAYIEECKVSTDTLKNWIRKQVGKVEKTDWSFVTSYQGQPVNDNFITYMSKGNLEPSLVHGVAPEKINSLKEAWVPRATAKQRTLLSYIVKETPEQRKLRQEDMLKEICKRVEESEDQTIQFIIGTIRQVVIIENRNVLGRYKLRDYYDTVRARTHRDMWEHNMVALCQKDFF